MINPEEAPISFNGFILKSKDIFRYLLSKWLWIFLFGLFLGVIGIFYAWKHKATYIAEITFAAENEGENQLGGYAGIAAQFGFDVSNGGGGGMFAGDNLIQFLKSRLLVRKTLLTPINIGGRKELLIDYFLRLTTDQQQLSAQSDFKDVAFVENMTSGNRKNDSILMRLTDDIIKSFLRVEKIEKNVSIISATMKSENEYFSKTFIELLTGNAIQYYIDYRSKKYRQNVAILQHQTDSVRSLLAGDIVSVASSTDLNVNPIKQIVRAKTQRKQVDVQVNGQVYGELLKQLEFAKIALRRETPLIQIIDVPILPLEKKKPGRLFMAISFAFVGVFIMVFYYVLRRLVVVN